MPVACARCHAELTSSAKFCGACGGEPVATRLAEFAAGVGPSIHTPKHLAERILTSKALLEGERKQVTVLFADMRASMELVSDRDPEEARALLDPVLERMMDAVHAYEGTVNQVMGDGIMALFGAPVANEDHAVRACYAALRMQESVGVYAAEMLRERGTVMQIRVGLNSGEVVVRAISSDLHLEYTAVGETTHLAARMEQLATPGTILLARNTLRLAEGLIDVRSLGPVPIRGLSHPVEVYELVGVSSVSPPIRGRGRELTPFVGRDSEIRQLQNAVGRATAGHGGVVALVGAPGVGKSRLCYELSRMTAAPDWQRLQASGDSTGTPARICRSSSYCAATSASSPATMSAG